MQDITQEIKNSGGRIREVKAYFKLTFEDLQKITGISNTGLQAIMNGNYKGFDVSILLKLHKKYPKLNIDWVLTGRGEMIYKNAPASEEHINELKDMALALTRAKMKIEKLEEQLREYTGKDQASS